LESERQVPTHEGHNLAKSYECPFIEASARSRINVEESFFQLVRALHTTRHDTTPPTTRHHTGAKADWFHCVVQVRQIRHVRKMGEAGSVKNKKKGRSGCSLF
jgi:hypothetical protein